MILRAICLVKPSVPGLLGLVHGGHAAARDPPDEAEAARVLDDALIVGHRRVYIPSSADGPYIPGTGMSLRRM